MKIAVPEAHGSIVTGTCAACQLGMILKQAVIPLPYPDCRITIKPAELKNIETGTGGATDRTSAAPQTMIGKFLPLRQINIQFRWRLFRDIPAEEAPGIFRYMHLPFFNQILHGRKEFIATPRATADGKTVLQRDKEQI